MLSRLSFIAIVPLFSVLVSVPDYSAAAVYEWEDANGVITYSDNPEKAPSNVEVKILSQDSKPQTVSEPESVQIAAPELQEPSSRVVTQGEFAIELVEELGLADAPTADAATDLLSSVRISPRLGQWELEEPMSSELTARLRKLTVAAAEMGWITLTPEQVLLAFDTASALLGLSLPVTAYPDEASASPYPITEVPPLVYVAPPPPDLYPYYLWTPVAGGFWWGDVLFPGFFVLDANLFFSDHHHFFYRDRLIGLDSGRIGRHFRSHLKNHQIQRSSVLSNPSRAGLGDGSAASRQMIHPPDSPVRFNSGFRSFVPGFSGTSMARHYNSSRPTTMPSAIGRQSLRSRSIGSMPQVRTPFRSLPVRRDSSPSFSAPRPSAQSMNRGFNTGMSRGSFGRSAGRGSSHSR